MYFTVVTPTRVLQVRARSYAALVRALAETNIKWVGIHEVSDEGANQ